MKGKKYLFNAAVCLFLAIAGFFCLFPLLMALLNSFKTNGELLTDILSLPKSLNLKNYARSLEKMHYVRSLGNTAILAVTSVSLIILFSSLAGWKLCRTKTKFSRIIFSLFVFSMLIPFSSIMIPLYKVVLLLQIKNSILGLSFVYAGLGVSMAIFLFHGFVKSIPLEIEEAAAIDGGGELYTFFVVVFPLLKPIIVTVAITNVLWVWNDFLLPLIVISDYKKYTLLLSTNTLFGQYSNDWTAILSAMILAAAPVIIFYALFQKEILSGIVDGAVKG